MRASSQPITFLSLLGLLSFLAISVPGSAADNFGPGGHFLRVRNDVHKLVARASNASPSPRVDPSSTDGGSAAASQSVKPASSSSPQPPPATSSSPPPASKPSTTKQQEQQPSSHAHQSSRPPVVPSSSPPVVQQPPSSSAGSSSSSISISAPLLDGSSAIYIPGAPTTDSAVFLPPPTDTSNYAAPAPTDNSTDTSSVPSSDGTDTNSPSDTVTANGFLANKGAVAALGSIGGIAAAAIIAFVSISIIRRRSRQRRQDRWERKSHIWDDRADDGMAGFEKVEPGSIVQMSDMANGASHRPANAENYHLSFNSARDYFASPSGAIVQPRSQDGYGEAENHSQDYAPASEYPPNLLDAYGVRESYAATNQHAAAPTIDYPPGMAYSPELHDLYDAQQQRKLQDLHQYTLDSNAQETQNGYTASPLAHAINRGAY